MNKEYLPLFLDFNETTQDLTDEECGRLIRALVDYANGEAYEHHLTGAEKIAFRFMKGLIDRNASLSEKRARAGSTRNKPEQNITNDNKTEQNITNENKTEQTETKIAIETETETDIETETKKRNKKEKQNPERDARFDRFWFAYPKHEAKQSARKVFDKLDPDDSLLEIIIAAIEKQKQSDQWTRDGGQYIPYPATWLNQRRWEDETLKPAARKPNNPAVDYEQRDYTGKDREFMDLFMQGLETG